MRKVIVGIAVCALAVSANAAFILNWGAAAGFTTDGTNPILPGVGQSTVANLYLAPDGVADEIGPGGVPQGDDILLDTATATNGGGSYEEYGFFGPALFNAPFQAGSVYGVIFQDSVIDAGDALYRGPLQAANDNPGAPVAPDTYEMNTDLAYGDAFNGTVVPEPASLALLGLGALVVLRMRKR